MTAPAIPARKPSALLWVTAGLATAYLPVFLGKIVFFRDPAHWNYPAVYYLRASLLRGELPIWNPDQGLGFSVLANPLYGLFYPPNWLYLLVPSSLVAQMLTWQGFAHLLWGSAGIVLLARRLKMGEVGAAVAGLSWGLSGYVTATWSTGLLLIAGSWVPWCGVGFLGLARAPGPRAIVRAVLPLAMAILLGELFVAAMGAAFGLATAAVAVRADRRADPTLPWQPRRLAIAAAASLLIAGGIGAIVVLPARAVAAATHRAVPLSRLEAEVCSLHPLRLIELAAPGSMGFAFGDYPAKAWVGEPLLDGMPLMYSVYMGAATLALALAAFGRGRRMATAFGLLAAVVLVLALGRHTPVHQWFRTVVRPFGYMRYPEKYLVLFVGWLGLLAGLGAQRLLVERARLWRRTGVWLGLLLLLAASGPPIFPGAWGPYVFWGALRGAAAVAVVLAVQALVARGNRFAPLLLVVGVAADLAESAFPHLAFGPAEVATRVPRAAEAILADHRARGGGPAPPRAYRADRTDETVRRFVPATSQAEGEMRLVQVLIANTVTTFGIATIFGYDAAIPVKLAEVWQSGLKRGQSVLRLFGTGYAILPIENPAEPGDRRQGLEPMLDPLPGARLYRVPGTLPRVYLAGAAEVVPDGAAMERLFSPAVVEGGLALLAPGAEPAALAGPPGRAGECTLEAFSNRRVAARCRVDRPAVAVFVEQHDAGWRAEVDGRPAPLLRANLLMRAVRLEPGPHTLVLSYAPPGVGSGAAISSLSVLALLGLWAASLRRS